MSSGLELRDYQHECVDATFDALREHRRVVNVLPTGSGKTVIFSHLAAEWIRGAFDKRVLILVHRDELVRQTVAKIEAVTGLVPGVEQADQHAGATDLIVVASVPTLARDNRLTDYLRQVGNNRVLTIVDECFAAGTLVGDRPIESLRPGDIVPAWNEETGAIEQCRVIATKKSVPSALVRVTYADGRTTVCTPSHPLLTEQGWCPAGTLSRGASVISFDHDETRSAMHMVQHADRDRHQSTTRCVETQRSNVLLDNVSRSVGVPGQLAANGANQSEVRVSANDRSQPDAVSRSASKDGRDVANDRPQTAHSRGQWSTSYSTATTASTRTRVAGRGDDRPFGWSEALPLQRGSGSAVGEGDSGDRRRIPLLAGTPRRRSTAGWTPSVTRVVDVEVLKPGRDGTYGGRCPGGAVFNIEVEGAHTYLVNGGIVAHNCHHAVAPSYRKILDTVSGSAVGFTATLMRSDDLGLGDVWETVSYQRSIKDMIEAGWLVDVRGKSVPVDDLDLDAVKRTGGDYSTGDLGDALQASMALETTAKAYVEQARDRLGIAFWPTVETAERAVDAFDGQGITSAVVTGTTPHAQRQHIYAEQAHGRIQVIHNCMVLAEGWDSPPVSCCVVGRPTSSTGLFIQMVGRVLRPWPTGGKRDALVLDVTGAARKHSLATLGALTETPDRQLADGESLLEFELAVADERQDLERKIILQSTMVDVDLFAASTTHWLQTHRGVWFISVMNGYYFLFEERDDSGYTLGFAPKTGKPERLSDPLPLDLAIAVGEQHAMDADPSLASKTASWRRRKANASEKQLTVLGLPKGTELSKQEASNVISVKSASARLDQWAPR